MTEKRKEILAKIKENSSWGKRNDPYFKRKVEKLRKELKDTV